MENSLFIGQTKDFIDNEFKNLTNMMKPQSTVFHYTSLETLINIIENKSLWFSNIGDLNDPQEMKFGQKVIENIILTKCYKSEEIIKCIKELGKVLFDNFNYTPFYLLSASENKDSYQQWINYGDSGEGVSIGFDRIKIYNLLESSKTTIRYSFPVQYYEEVFNDSTSKNIYNQVSTNKIDCFEDTVVNCFNFLTENVKEINAMSFVVQQDNPFSTINYYHLYILFSSMIKHQFHKEEKEWRLLFSTPNESKYISSNKQPKEIQEIKLKAIQPTIENSNEYITSVIIGPRNSRNPDYFNRMERMLMKKIRDIKLENSIGSLK